MEDKKLLRIELTRPFPDDAILFKPERQLKDGKYIVVPYLDVRYIVYRLNSMIPGEWELDVNVQPLVINVPNESGFLAVGHMATAKLTILGTTMTGTGSSYLLYDSDIEKLKRQDVKIDPKSAETDAIRRAAANHSIGAYLWFYKKTIIVDDLDEIKNPKESNKLVVVLNELKELGRKLYTQSLQFNKTKLVDAEEK